MTARLWNADTGLPLGEPLRHDDKVKTVELSPDGKTAVSSSADHTSRLWDVATGRLLHRLSQDDEVWVAAFSPDGQTVLTAGGDRTARLWDAQPGQPLHHELPLPGLVKFAAYSPDGKQILLGASDGEILRCTPWN